MQLMANTLSITDASAILQAVVNQARGLDTLAPINAADIVTVAQTALLTGYDPLINSISQVLSKTLFSIRNYNGKFKSMNVDSERWGNHVRKIQMEDTEVVTDKRLPLTDGQSVDMFVVNKPSVLQTNFYGEQSHEIKHLTIFKDQLDTAFQSAAQFGSFISMIMTNRSNFIEQVRENTARLLLANVIAATYNLGNVIHLITEYNTATGLTLDNETVLLPENYRAFIQWVYARVAKASSMLTERSILYHAKIGNKNIMRHTPAANQRLYMLSDYQYQIDAMALSNTYHDNYLKMAERETLNYWQSIDSPKQIDITAGFTDLTTGAPATKAITLDNVFGIIMDTETCGITHVNQWQAASPFNAEGGYTNFFTHETARYWYDATENAIVFMMD